MTLQEMKILLTALALGVIVPVSICAEDDTYQNAALKVIELSNVNLSEERLVMMAQAMNPGLPLEEAQIQAAQTFKVMQSAEFKANHAAIYMKHFSEPELVRLADLLGDPVLKKFNEKRAIYGAEFAKLFNQAMDESTKAEQE